ncbi:hypothetical protein [Streptomyces sp. NBC_00059]|uniref:hypothetical protein n=1 Tax=Streptomyces sp. NBC_00059 TaxID=2975635 RepID=UPI00225400BC|nr:hypothetical protein [Streptomyces sp. NBC_00059]MCX5414519.1 hypothetical protein [Streptomyces sp. NBC_00059]
MPLQQRVTWTVLPAGFSADGTKLLVSLFVAPQLSTGEAAPPGNRGTLGPFPDFLRWPEQVAAVSFAFATTDGVTAPQDFPVGPVAPAGTPPDPSLWQRLFRPDTVLESFAFDQYMGREVATCPARAMTSSAQHIYATAATRFPDRPPLRQELDAMSPEGGMQGLAPSPSEGMETHKRLLGFHHPPANHPTLAPGAENTDPPLETPVPDFHSMLTSLSDHPALLRRLGLILDFELPAEALPDSAGSLFLTVRPTWTPLLTGDDPNLRPSHDVTPHTAYVLDRAKHAFVAAARTTQPADPLAPPVRGLVPLPQADFSIEQADVDGALLQLDATDPGSQGLPVVRTGGLTLARNERMSHIAEDFAAADEQKRKADELVDDAAATGQVKLFSEDLVRGHRLDVWDDGSARWFSLQQRDVAYCPPGLPQAPLLTASDEGFFQVSMATRPETEGRLYLHDNVITWDGWSLAAPRPGKVLSADEHAPDPANAATQPQRIGNPAAPGVPLEIISVARPGTLPRLRFGRSYRVRVRTVDLAGNGLTAAQADTLMAEEPARADLALPAAGPQVFRRFESVPSPVVVPRLPLVDGARTQRLVVRSDPERPPDAYAAGFNASPLVTGGAHGPYAPHDERHVVAPKASLECVERHGLLDAAIGSSDPAVRTTAYQLALHESGSLDDATLPGAQAQEGLDSADGGKTPPLVLHTGDQVPMPYLPDPLSTGAVFFGLPGLPPGEPFAVDWDGDTWHSPASFRIRVTEGTGPPQFDAGTRVLTVQLPKATVAPVTVCSRIAAEDTVLGLAEWCRESSATDDAQVGRLMTSAHESRHWLFTPGEEITLVHAVQRPLSAPLLQFGTAPVRAPSATTEHLLGAVTVHTGSTERVDVLAEWTDVTDEGPDGRVERPDASPALTLPLCLADANGPDGKPHRVPPSCTLTDGLLTFSTELAETLAANANSAPPYRRLEFGDTKHRRVRCHPVATTRFGEYFPASFSDPAQQSSLTVPGETAELSVPSSAPPSAPGVLYCMPTLAFDEPESPPGTVVRRRRGGGIRVFLDRPWYSSGDGELLGILIDDAPGPPSHDVEPVITLIGRDPIHRSAPVGPATTAMFTNAVRTVGPLPRPLPGPGGGVAAGAPTVTALGFTPQFDTARQRWFCDLDIDTGDAYLPFVRLALVRLQPESIKGAEISTVVLGDLVRTLPGRELTVSGDSPLVITLTGPSYRPDGRPPAKVRARLERRHPAVEDEDLGWMTVEGSGAELVAADAETSDRPVFTGEVALPERWHGWHGRRGRRGHGGPGGHGGPRGRGLRLMVEETESVRADGPGEPEERVIYCDTVDLGDLDD